MVGIGVFLASSPYLDRSDPEWAEELSVSSAAIASLAISAVEQLRDNVSIPH